MGSRDQEIEDQVLEVINNNSMTVDLHNNLVEIHHLKEISDEIHHREEITHLQEAQWIHFQIEEIHHQGKEEILQVNQIIMAIQD